jgi:hypothetical protein
MVLDEHELRQHLVAAADQVGAPRFTIEALIKRVRRRRAKIIGIVSGSLLAVAAIAVAVPVALSSPGNQPVAHPEIGPFVLSFTMTVNGQSLVFPKDGVTPSFAVTPGEHLKIRLGVIVPAHARVTTLWLGVSTGAFGTPGRDGRRPVGLDPVLAHTKKPLTPGLHTFRLAWAVPVQLSRGTSSVLVAAWATKQEDARVSQVVATFVARR